ncbi:hypothetical protein ATANTOWER_028836 [Ataeniobius toweri]|uniref:Ubiquitin-like protease family profile domain-containing protein n=1 Tax=Ataeniobius toweri TaxID=208326 RepID=A0ABU7ABA3_9TELE|nr:hypothetical protein [Ataeniobius toweri]
MPWGWILMKSKKDNRQDGDKGVERFKTMFRELLLATSNVRDAANTKKKVLWSKNTAHHHENTNPKVRHGDCGIMLWDAFLQHGQRSWIELLGRQEELLFTGQSQKKTC